MVVQFFAPVDEVNPDKQIKYDFRSLGEDEELIRNDDEKYCLKQVYKMCYYISKLYQYEVLRMRCEFAKDFHGTIWFQYASSIVVRPNMNAMQANDKAAKRMTQINDAHRKKLLEDLDQHQNANGGNTKLVTSLQNVMEANYQQMRKNAGIEEILDNSDGSDYETE